MSEFMESRRVETKETNFDEFLDQHPELDDLQESTAPESKVPFYMGQKLVSRFFTRPERYPTSTQTLTPGGWKYDGSKED